MVTVTDPAPKADVAALKFELRGLGITHDQVAEAAGVTRPLVVNVLAGRRTSSNVVATAQRLIARRRRSRRPRPSRSQRTQQDRPGAA